MNKILYYFNLEWSKYKRNWLARVLFFAFVILFPFCIFLGKEIFENVPPPFPSYKTFYEFPTVWDYQGHVGNWLVSFCLGFLMIYMITSEVDYKTMRQGVINGMSRKEFFISKLVAMVAMALFATFLYYITTIVIGIVNTESPDLELIFDNNWAGIRFFIMSIGYMSLGLLIGMVVRRGFLSLLLYFSYMMFIESILRGIHLYYFESRSILFYPTNAIEDLMPNKLYEFADSLWIKEAFGNSFLLSHTEAMITSSIYISIFIYLAWLAFRKKDL